MKQPNDPIEERVLTNWDCQTSPVSETQTPQDKVKQVDRPYRACPKCGCTLFSDDERPCKSDLNPHFDPRLHKLHNEIGSKPEHWT